MCIIMASNSQSYQKYDGASGTYQTLSSKESNGNGSSATAHGSRRKWIYGAVVLVVVAAVYMATSLSRTNPDKAVNKALAGDKNIAVDANGKLKLFDELSK